MIKCILASLLFVLGQSDIVFSGDRPFDEESAKTLSQRKTSVVQQVDETLTNLPDLSSLVLSYLDPIFPDREVSYDEAQAHILGLTHLTKREHEQILAPVLYYREQMRTSLQEVGSKNESFGFSEVLRLNQMPIEWLVQKIRETEVTSESEALRFLDELSYLWIASSVSNLLAVTSELFIHYEFLDQTEQGQRNLVEGVHQILKLYPKTLRSRYSADDVVRKRLHTVIHDRLKKNQRQLERLTQLKLLCGKALAGIFGVKDQVFVPLAQEDFSIDHQLPQDEQGIRQLVEARSIELRAIHQFKLKGPRFLKKRTMKEWEPVLNTLLQETRARIRANGADFFTQYNEFLRSVSLPAAPGLKPGSNNDEALPEEFQALSQVYATFSKTLDHAQLVAQARLKLVKLKRLTLSSDAYTALFESLRTQD